MSAPTTAEANKEPGQAVPALEVIGLGVSARSRKGRVVLLEDVTFSVPADGTVGIVGESGSGKSMTSLAILGLLPDGVRIDSGEVRLFGENLVGKSQRALRALRGPVMSMVFQDPMTSLDPSFTIANQISDVLKIHRGLRKGELRDAIVAELERVRIPSVKERMNQYPHQMSGGMRQRIISAIALAGRPQLLIADEPTTALDATTQAQYLKLLRSIQATTGFALVMIAHDLSIIRRMCEHVIVMYAGQIVEQGPLDKVLGFPKHPYTRALLDIVPQLGQRDRLKMIEGQAPSPDERAGTGCSFAPRCEFARPTCTESDPKLSERSGEDHLARCFATEPDGWITT